MNKKLSLLIVLLVLISCNWEESGVKAIYFYNNMVDTIAVTVDGRFYDSNNPNMFDSLPNYGHYVIVKPNNMFYYEILAPDQYFNSFPDKKGKIYIFSLDTLNKYSWKEIRESSNYLRRYDLSQHELDSMNWTITYP